MASLAERLLEGYKHAQPVLLEGDAAGGKTAAVAFCASRVNAPLVRFNMTPNTTIAQQHATTKRLATSARSSVDQVILHG